MANKLSKQKRTFILISFTIFYLAVLIRAGIPLLTNAYTLTDSDLFKIDSTRILSRAYYLSSAKSSSNSGIEFQDLTRKTFRLAKSNLNEQAELKTLHDTLQFSRTVVTIYTSKEGLSNYRDQDDDSEIPVFRIIIGNRSFGNLNAVNVMATRNLDVVLAISTFVYGSFLLTYFKRART